MKELHQLKIQHLLNAEDITRCNYNDILSKIANQYDQKKSYFQIDPRNQNRILYCPDRLHRPYDWQDSQSLLDKDCPICSGNTTRIWDLAPLSQGYTFINENLFPAILPDLSDVNLQGESLNLYPTSGTHFIQWHSNQHDKDFHNMPVDDIVVNLKRLAKLEKFLLSQQSPFAITDSNELRGYVCVIKNFGQQAGCSLSHGHLQIIHTTTLPGRIKQDIDFAEKYGQGFSSYIQQKSPQELAIMSYDAIKITTPFCLKRPLEAIISFADLEKNYLYQLNAKEIQQLALAFSKLGTAVCDLMPAKFNLQPAYNIVFHNGPIAGLYIEFLPCTQKLGGFENLGLYLCNTTPVHSTQMYKEI